MVPFLLTHGVKDIVQLETLLGDKVETLNSVAMGLTPEGGYTEQVFEITDNGAAISPTNGNIQTWTLDDGVTLVRNNSGAIYQKHLTEERSYV